MNDDDELWDKLEAQGEGAVRKNLAKGTFGEHKKKLVEEWLRQKDHSRSEVSNLKQTRIARSAKNAAWTSATAAVIAAIFAVAAFLR